MGKVLFCFGVISLVFAIVFNIVWWYGVKVGCVDYLKLTGDAPSIQRAGQFLDEALGYIEKNGLTSGNSAILFRTPTSDVGIWYAQIKGAKETIETIIKKKEQDSISQLERDNALMKVREVVLDEGKKGTEVTTPPHLSWFPYQVLITLWWILTIILFVVGGIWWAIIKIEPPRHA